MDERKIQTLPRSIASLESALHFDSETARSSIPEKHAPECFVKLNVKEDAEIPMVEQLRTLTEDAVEQEYRVSWSHLLRCPRQRIGT